MKLNCSQERDSCLVLRDKHFSFKSFKFSRSNRHLPEEVVIKCFLDPTVNSLKKL